MADLSSNQITIAGKNLMAKAAPVVSFGGTRLSLISYTSAQIVAYLPGSTAAEVTS